MGEQDLLNQSNEVDAYDKSAGNYEGVGGKIRGKGSKAKGKQKSKTKKGGKKGKKGKKGKGTKKKRGPSKWIMHVKAFCKKTGKTFPEALKDPMCRKSFHH